jgi:cytochrome c peroxidase
MRSSSILATCVLCSTLFATCTSTARVHERSGAIQDPRKEPQGQGPQGNDKAPRTRSEARPPETGKPSPQTVEATAKRKDAFGAGRATSAGARGDVHVPHMEPPPAGPDAPPATPTPEPSPEQADLNNAERSIYRPTVMHRDFPTTMRDDVAAREGVLARQRSLLAARYDLADKPLADVRMSGGRKAVQAGVRVRLPEGTTWASLAAMTPDAIKAANAFPRGFRSLPHVKHEVGGQVFPDEQIADIRRQEGRELQRFDVDFDLPEQFTPEFPPPIFLQNHPELGDVSQGKLLTLKNFFAIMNGKITPVQMEGLRLLLTPQPQEEFNQTDDRKVADQSQGVSCLDCHSNFHTNAAFHLTPDIRPQANRFRLDTTSLRGMFNQQIHGSKRSLRSIEDFTEFEQRTAYFNGDHVSATKKGVFLPDRANQVAMMAQMQNMIDFPPAPKLLPTGRLDARLATEQELRGEQLFFGAAQCSQCHPAPFYLDDKMHDLKLERFFDPVVDNGHFNAGDGPIKTFTLRGIKDSPPYLHDGRLLTLDDTVEFFNLVLGLRLDDQQKQDLVAFLLCL